MRFSVIVPLICTLAAFVLSMLCLFAGSKPNFMQDFEIITLNTSSLGHDTSPTTSSTSSSPTSIGSWLNNIAGDPKGDIMNEFNEIRGDVADKLAEKLGIHQWYNLHMTDMCMGTYTPRATDRGAKMNVSGCTPMKAMYHFDPTSQLQKELDSGPLAGKINLADLGYSDDIKNGIKAFNIAMTAMFILYCIGAAASGLCIILALISFFSTGRLTSCLNFLLAIVAFLALAISSAIVTAIIVKATEVVNQYGNDVGLYAYKGHKFLAMTWGGTAAMGVAMGAWVVIFCMGRKDSRRASEKPY
ncbi:hypothetical protein VE01_08068 [Pseudogymnoascus verrucosus]|uniref:Uncharacterized protein n=1 Tax=Pseudogymnoascus verrucosus TaxID=342668 RepID=A0A1B8GCT7_9PEZI|nr:uncharacterized protein VE01_08068 [Pseudogymnoascus verrucosus]OBT93632.1 hypothetical protein VE01_08068 [Pseudogymnoascus verrucosus]